jgi:hypothetical protein
MAHQAGFDNVVASLGTALTPGQVALLTRYADRIVLAYDVDAAGEKAGTLGVQALAGLVGQLQHDSSGVKLEDVRVARLPDGKDPDEVVRESPEAWTAAIAAAKPLVEYLIGHHAARFDLKLASGRIGFVEAVMPAISDIADPLRRDEALQEVRRVSGVEDRTLRAVLDRRVAAAAGSGVARDQGGRITADSVLASPDALPINDILRAVTPVEAELLRLLLLIPDLQLKVVGSSVRTGCPRRSRASCSARSCSSASPTTRGSTPRSTRPRSWPDSTMKRPPSLARCMPSRGRTRGRSTGASSTTRSAGSFLTSRTNSCASAATTTRPPRGRPTGPATPRRSPA